MSKINHHLSDDVLLAYATGALPEAYALVVATHISLCDQCRAALAAQDAVGGAILEQAIEPAMTAPSFEGAMARIKAGPKSPIAAPAPIADAVLPAPVREYVGGDIDAVKWRSVGGGVRQAVLDTAPDASVRLLYIPGGTKIPDHGHRGLELTMVLQGAYSDEEDRFARGDIEIADQSFEHTPIAEPGEPCICLAATDAPLKFNAFLPRIAQRFLGI